MINIPNTFEEEWKKKKIKIFQSDNSVQSTENLYVLLPQSWVPKKAACGITNTWLLLLLFLSSSFRS